MKTKTRETDLAAYVKTAIPKVRGKANTFFRGTVTRSTFKEGTAYAYLVDVLPAGSTTSMVDVMCTLTCFIPQVGDDVECVWRDDYHAYVQFTMSGTTR